MKVSRIFAGLLIILIGIALFLSNFDVLKLNWHFIFRLWPILLVFAGISVLVSNSKLKAVLYVVTAILVLIWIFSVASIGWGNFHNIVRSHDVHHQEFNQSLEKGVRQASLTLSSGAGSFFIKDTTDRLFEANCETDIGDYSLDIQKNGSAEHLSMALKQDENDWHWNSSQNTVKIKLNPAMIWNLTIDVGASSDDFDLSNYKIASASIKSGASSIKLRLGDKLDTTHLSLDAGASSITIYVPQKAGCQILDNAELSRKSFTDFTKSNYGVYRTSNFDDSKKKVFIDVQAGVSSITVTRY
jgi:hypothetical protein